MSLKSAKEKFEMTAVLPIVPVMSSSYKSTILYIMVLHVLSLKKVVIIVVTLYIHVPQQSTNMITDITLQKQIYMYKCELTPSILFSQ